MPELSQAHTRFVEPQLAAYAGEWFAIQTKPRHEKKVAFKLEEKDIEVFLPLYTSLHQWSDRRQEVQLPLFPNYVFVRIGATQGTYCGFADDGVRSFVGMRGKGVCIPDDEVEAIQKILDEESSLSPIIRF